ncbi:DEK domain-containing chromatin-associated protein 1-like [Rutidosis leptorrhynchoides]|uniref:DEK domain-containing chromatin-associated protein 1-like n=1 Tax=Rutidosis leptorrhynchoides TaxID=125765 RepID=UPI003A9945C8
MSKREPDDILLSLHMVLFNKLANVNTLTKNIGMFSGFVWTDDEEKQRTEVKQKLDKLTKEKLFDLCDLLNLQINKSSIKKKDVSLKLLEFLQSPHVTTEVLLSEKEQKSKKQKAKAERTNNTLPFDIIENITWRLPTEEIVRSSILSKQWRYSWTKIPKVAFYAGIQKLRERKKFYRAIHQFML